MIPNQAHLIWFGPKLPFAYALAVRSAAVEGKFERVILHHDHDLSHDATVWSHLTATPGFESRPLDQSTLPLTGELAGPLQRLYGVLEKPAARANLWRAALLFQEGGVYLDTDTLTIADMTAVRERSGAFCGVEPVALPGYMRSGRSPVAWTGAGLRLVAPAMCRRLPHGWRSFRRIEGWYAAAPNNAVVGAAPKHPFFAGLLERMLRVPPERQKVRFALGTHLLQGHVAAHLGQSEARAFREAPKDYVLHEDLAVYSAPYFYPVGPEVSQHWFRAGEAELALHMVAAETKVVHWYASVRTQDIVPLLTPTFIEANANDLAFCKLAAPFL